MSNVQNDRVLADSERGNPLINSVAGDKLWRFGHGGLLRETPYAPYSRPP
jgi:hypothetical protein